MWPHPWYEDKSWLFHTIITKMMWVILGSLRGVYCRREISSHPDRGFWLILSSTSHVRCAYGTVAVLAVCRFSFPCRVDFSCMYFAYRWVATLRIQFLNHLTNMCFLSGASGLSLATSLTLSPGASGVPHRWIYCKRSIVLNVSCSPDTSNFRTSWRWRWVDNFAVGLGTCSWSDANFVISAGLIISVGNDA